MLWNGRKHGRPSVKIQGGLKLKYIHKGNFFLKPLKMIETYITKKIIFQGGDISLPSINGRLWPQRNTDRKKKVKFRLKTVPADPAVKLLNYVQINFPTFTWFYYNILLCSVIAKNHHSSFILFSIQ